MRNIFCTCLFLLYFSANSAAQVTVQPFNLIVPCCSHTDSIDIGNDGTYDLNVSSHYGIDAAAINTAPLISNLKITNPQVAGSTFISFWGGAPLAQTTIGCMWNSVWNPNTGHKYQGFRIINAPADTTFGWIQYDFRGNAATCSDTIYGIKLAYSNIPNVHLTAGQMTITTAPESLQGQSFKVYPNPAENILHLQLPSSSSTPIIKVFDSIGRLCPVKNSGEVLSIDISNLSKGLYIIEAAEENRVLRHRFIK